MKNKFLFTLLLGTFALAACGKANNTSSSEPVTVTSAVQSEVSTEEVTESASQRQAIKWGLEKTETYEIQPFPFSELSLQRAKEAAVSAFDETFANDNYKVTGAYYDAEGTWNYVLEEEKRYSADPDAYETEVRSFDMEGFHESFLVLSVYYVSSNSEERQCKSAILFRDSSDEFVVLDVVDPIANSSENVLTDDECNTILSAGFLGSSHLITGFLDRDHNQYQLYICPSDSEDYKEVQASSEAVTVYKFYEISDLITENKTTIFKDYDGSGSSVVMPESGEEDVETIANVICYWESDSEDAAPEEAAKELIDEMLSFYSVDRSQATFRLTGYRVFDQKIDSLEENFYLKNLSLPENCWLFTPDFAYDFVGTLGLYTREEGHSMTEDYVPENMLTEDGMIRMIYGGMSYDGYFILIKDGRVWYMQKATEFLEKNEE